MWISVYWEQLCLFGIGTAYEQEPHGNATLAHSC